MQRAIEAARLIGKNPEENGLIRLEEINLHNTFKPIYRLNLTLEDANLISAFVILAYDPDSTWIDIRKDRYENKLSILKSLNCNIHSEVFDAVLKNSNDTVNDVVLGYLADLTDWRWQTIFTQLDYHANMIRFVNQKTESEKSIDKMNKEGEVKTLVQEYDLDLVSKVNKQKGELLEQAISAREKADKLLADIKKDFVSTDHAIQSDFLFSFTDTAKRKVDVLSWKDFIRGRNEKKII